MAGKQKLCFRDGRCAYLESLPGSAHMRCTFNWQKGVKEGAPMVIKMRLNQWSAGFPLNFDPVWLDECSQKAEKRDPEWVYEPNAMENLLSALG